MEDKNAQKNNSNLADSFWRVMESLSQKQLSDYLQFVTGSSRLNLTATNHTVNFQKSKNIIPQSHTCGNAIDLGIYDSDQELKQKLLYAIEHHRGFIEEGFSYGKQIHEDYDLLIYSPQNQHTPEIEKNILKETQTDNLIIPGERETEESMIEEKPITREPL